MTDTAICEQDMPEIVTEEYAHFRRCGVPHKATLEHLAEAYGIGTKQIERHRRRGLARVVEERTIMNISPRAVADLQQAERGEWNSMRKARREDLVDQGLVRVDGDVPSLTAHGKHVLREAS